MDIKETTDTVLLNEIQRRFEEKQASIAEMDTMTKKLLKLNEKNKNAQEVKSKFLSLVKNEFNNPMSSLLNIINLMIKKSSDPQISELSLMMKYEILKLNFSLKNIFAASEIEAGEIANDYSNVNLQEIYEDTKNYFSAIIEDKSLKLKFINNLGQSIISDSQKLEIILLNLISNACEYSYNNSEIIISIDSDNDNYILTVEDNGEGIKSENIDDIYNHFVHFETGRTRATAGLGLGLSVVQGLVQALNGSINHQQKEKGTIFIIKIAKIDENNTDISTGIGNNGFLFNNDEGMVEF